MKTLAVGSAMIDTIAIISSDRIERMIRSATGAFSLWRVALAAAIVALAGGSLAGCGEKAELQPVAAAPGEELPEIDALLISEEIIIESDGWTLHGTFSRPPNEGAKPAALLLHRAAGNRDEYEALAGALATRGVSSLALDLRGHGESVNLGRFEPPYADNLHINEGAYKDVIAALEWIASRPDVDAKQLAVVGASYSGEAAGRAMREGARPATAYVMLSPGNFSDDSIGAIEGSGAKWLFVRTVEESPAALEHIDALFDVLAANAPGAERLVLDGAGHATHIFDGRPEFVEDLAQWIATALTSDDPR